MSWGWEKIAQKFRKGGLPFWNRLKKIFISWNISLLVMSLACMTMTRKLSTKLWNGTTSPRYKKTGMSKSKIKCFLSCSIHRQGIVHKEFVPQGKTLKQHLNWEVFERLREKVSCVWRQITGCLANLSYSNFNKTIFGF